MDSITHAVLGACVGEAMAGKKIGKKAMLFGAIANSVPDVDVVTALWMTQTDSLLAHRGFTHSILFAVLFTFLAAWAMKKIFSNIDFSKNQWLLLIGVNLFLHLLIDVFTSYGTGLFEPFSHERVAFDMMFVADPAFTFPLIVSSLILIVLSNHSAKRKTWAYAGLILSFVYSCYALYHKIVVDRIVEKNLTEETPVSRKFIATPTPLNNFLWYVVVEQDTGFNIGYYSVFDRSPNIRFRFVPKNESLIDHQEDDVKNLIRFSQGYYTIEAMHDTLVFHDLRFGQIGGWFNGDAPFVFQKRLHSKTKDGSPFQQGRMKASEGKSMKEMIERIKGI